MTTAEFSFSNAISVGWSKTKQNFWLFVKVLIIAGVLYILSQYWKQAIAEAWSWFDSLISIVIWLIASAISMGFAHLALLVFDNKPATVKNWLVVEFKQYLNYLLASILVGLLPIILGLLVSLIVVPLVWPLVMAGLQPSTTVITIGLICLILLAWLATWYYLSFQFATLAVLDKKVSAWTGLKYSWQITKNHKGQLFLLTIFLGLINLLGLICLLVGLLMTLPTTWIAKVYAYRFLSGEVAVDVAGVDSIIEPPLAEATA